MEYRVDDKLSVRPITMDDTDLIVMWRNKPRIMNNFLVREPITHEDHVHWMHEKVEAGLVRQFIILEHADGDERPIGSVYIRDIDMDERTAEYGIFIGEDDALGHGYGNDIVNWAVAYARDMGIRTFYLRVLTDNTPAVRSYEQAGFKPIRIEKDFIEHRDLMYMEIEL